MQFYKLLWRKNPMAKKTIAELLTEAKVLREAMTKLKAENKAKKTAIAVEYADGLSEVEKTKQIAEAEKILNTAKEKAIALKIQFKANMKAIKSDVAFAKEILNFVNYKQNNSLPKQKNSFVVNGITLTFKREGIKDITIDISRKDWQKNLKRELALQGINGENRIADNIVYKASQLVNANIKI